MLLLKTHYSCLNVSKCVILFLFQDTGHKSVAIYSTNAVFTRYLLNSLSLLNKQESLHWEKRVKMQTSPRHSSKRWEKDYSLKWVRLILTIKFCMTPSLNTRKNHLKLGMEIYTTKAKSMRSEWKIINLAECPLPYVKLLVSKKTPLLHGFTTCSDMVLLQLTRTLRFLELTLWFHKVWMVVMTYRLTSPKCFSQTIRVSLFTLIAMDSTKPYTNADKLSVITGANFKK